MNNETVIELNGLSCCVGSRYLVNQISWKINRDDHWVVFGLNGCGKTSLLSIIAGYRGFTGGSLKVFGKEYSLHNIIEIRKQIGWVSSSFFDKFYNKETALSIVLSGLFGTLGMSYHVRNKDIKRAKELMNRFKIGNRINHPYDLLSKGERQNVLLARAFISNPKILILDEPVTGLDILAREHMLSIIRELSKMDNMTIIYVTHYTEEVLDIFDKCFLMSNGLLYKAGLTEDLFTDREISAFLNFPVRILRIGDRLQAEINVKSNVISIMSTNQEEESLCKNR
jgi:iron complex transport system ATP-binding protein